MTTTTLQPGDRISEYVLDEPIGEGGFGRVWKAHHHIWTDRTVAVKIPSDPAYVERLRDEGVLQEKVESDRVVQTIGFDPGHEPPYLIMEYVEGRSLRQILDDEGSLEPKRAVDIALQILDALIDAHEKGIVHRDVKPGNVLVMEDGSVKVSDFGLGLLLESEQELLASGALVTEEAREDLSGTRAYMAPEQKDPEKEVDPRADIYSLGILFFECLTGTRPEGGEVPSELVSGLPEAYDTFFRKAYTRLEKRWPTAQEAYDFLKTVPLPVPPHESATDVPKAGLIAEADARRLLGLSASALETQVEAGRLHFVWRGGRRFFDRREIDRFRKRIKDGQVSSLETMHAEGEASPPARTDTSSAGAAVRAVAFFFDWIAIVILTLILAPRFPFLRSIPMIGGAFLFVGFWYHTLLLGLTGTTLGKGLFGLKVVTLSGRRIGLFQAGVRTVGYFFSLLPAGMGFLMMPFAPKKRGIHDILSGTRVVWDEPEGRPVSG